MNRVLLLILWLLPAQSVLADTWQVLVCGHPGEKAFKEAFSKHAESLSAAAADTQVVLLCDDTDSSGSHALSGQGETPDKATLQALFEQLSTTLTQQDNLLLTLIGHGTYDGEEYRFNIPGPDLTGSELAAWLAELPTPHKLLVALTSASGALLRLDSLDSISLVTATRNGTELNAIEFDRFWADALQNGDADRDEIITLAEAFAHAEDALVGWYKKSHLLASEHPRMRLAETLPGSTPVVRVGALFGALDNPAVASLLFERQALAVKIETLKSERETLFQQENGAEDYYQKLESLLIELALLQKEIDAKLDWQMNDG